MVYLMGVGVKFGFFCFGSWVEVMDYEVVVIRVFLS